jgi:hypothetical protein
VDSLDGGEAVTAERYSGTLERLRQAIHRVTSRLVHLGLIILHINTRPRPCNCLQRDGLKVMGQCPSGPDLFPRDLNF